MSSNIVNTSIQVHSKLREIHSHKAQVAKKETLSVSQSRKCFNTRIIYNTDCRIKEVQSLLVRPLDQALRSYRTASVMRGKSYGSVVKGQSSNKVNIKRFVPDVAGTDKHMSASRNSVNFATGKANKHGLQCNPLDTCVNKCSQVQEMDTLQNIQGNVGETTKHDVEVNNSHQLNSVKSGDSTVVHIFDINASDNDTFLHSLLQNKNTRDVQNITDCQILERCKQQSHMEFGFIPLSDCFTF